VPVLQESSLVYQFWCSRHSIIYSVILLLLFSQQ